MIDRQILRHRHAEEEQRFIATHPRSAVLAKEAQANLLGGVPMAWMTRWPGSFPIFFESASGAHFSEIAGTAQQAIRHARCTSTSPRDFFGAAFVHLDVQDLR